LENEDAFSAPLDVIRTGSPDHWIPKTSDFVRYPALAIPLGNLKDYICPSSHIEFARSFIRDCDVFMVIGMSARDESICRLLGEAKNPKRILIANGNREEAKATITRIATQASAFGTIPSQWRFLLDGGFDAVFTGNHIESLVTGVAPEMLEWLKASPNGS
jgi:hypothetical protein